MRAVVLREVGGPEVLAVAEVPTPEPGPGQVRVVTSAIGVNPFDVKVRSGVFTPALPAVLGLEAAGVVDAVGEGADGVRVGDRVAGWAAGRPGAYAASVVLRAWAPVPDGLDDTAAAAVPVASEAARRGLHDLDVREGDTLLVHGASGAVGELAVQLAVARGATVVATASAPHHARLLSWGALPTSYGEGWAARVSDLAPGGVDAVLDVAGKGLLPGSISLTGGTDRVLTLADPDADALGVRFSSTSRPDPAALRADLESVARGTLTATVAHVLPLADAAEAHRLVADGHTGGKVVLVP